MTNIEMRMEVAAIKRKAREQFGRGDCALALRNAGFDLFQTGRLMFPGFHYGNNVETLKNDILLSQAFPEETGIRSTASIPVLQACSKHVDPIYMFKLAKKNRWRAKRIDEIITSEDFATLTPIGVKPLTYLEVLLGVNGQGSPTAKGIYTLLYTSPAAYTKYSKWVDVNIVNNPHANEGRDYVALSSPKSTGGYRNFGKDYRLSVDFAKELTMISQSRNARVIREYFINVQTSAWAIKNGAILPSARYSLQETAKAIVSAAETAYLDMSIRDNMLKELNKIEALVA